MAVQPPTSDPHTHETNANVSSVAVRPPRFGATRKGPRRLRAARLPPRHTRHTSFSGGGAGAAFPFAFGFGDGAGAFAASGFMVWSKRHLSPKVHSPVWYLIQYRFFGLADESFVFFVFPFPPPFSVGEGDRALGGVKASKISFFGV